MNQAYPRDALIRRSCSLTRRPARLCICRLSVLIIIRLRIRALSLFVYLTDLHRSTGLLRRSRAFFSRLRECAHRQQAR